MDRASDCIDDGFRYASMLTTRRLQVASVMPAMIAKETLALMRKASWDGLRQGIKVPRIKVYAMLLKALCGLRVRDNI
jgi:hypothetical protein